MQFFENNNQLEIEQFMARFPQEYKILSGYLNEDWKFEIDGKKLSFLHGEYKPIFINIEQILKNHEVYFYKNSLYKEPLAKALGLKKGKEKPYVCDASCGLLGDSLLIKSFGIEKLDLYERHPIPGALIENALRIFPQDMNFYFQSSKQLNKEYDVIYFDPMYSHTNQKSAPKKEMQIFREVIAADDDAAELGKSFLTQAKQRLVIKRPIKAEPLLSGVNHQIQGKSTRYDVYIKV